MKMKKASVFLYLIANIFNTLEIVAGLVLTIFGAVCAIIKPYAVQEIIEGQYTAKYKITQGGLNQMATICLAIGIPMLILSVILMILIKKASKWPRPSVGTNGAVMLIGLLDGDIILVLAGLFTLLARRQDPDMKEEQNHLGLRASRAIGNTFSYIVLAIISVVWILPFVFIVLQSFRTETTSQVGYIIPKQWGMDNYLFLFSPDCDFLTWYFNTFIIALACCILQTIMQLMMAYTLSRFRFKLRKPLMNIMLILGMFPGFLTMIVLYQVLKAMGLTQGNAVGGLILVGVASSGMGYYVSKGFFDTVPKSLDEAARIDGATRFQIFYKIILPLAKPIVIYTILTAFMGPWGDFIFARLIAFGDPNGYNVAVGLWSWLSQSMISDYYTRFCAGGVIVAIPVIVIFLFLQKYYVEGVTGGAVKG